MNTPDARFVNSDVAVPVKTKRGDRVSVRLSKNFGQNVIGDTCGFKPDVAKALVAKGAASYVKRKDAPKA